LNVEAYVEGEHGDNQVPVFSQVKIGGKKVVFTEEEKAETIKNLRMSALKVISKKGATIYAPANNTVNMIESIVKDKRELCVCSTPLDGEYGLKDLSIGVPVILGKDGANEILEWNLSDDEKKAFYLGAEEIKKAINSIL
ncbi:MAG: malate dehydrogenase, partial [Candidatus Bathyarchaeia archaeon]